MINLLPQEHQSNLKKEYSHRRITLVFIGLFCVGVAGLVTLFPAYLLSLQKEQEISNEDKASGIDLRNTISDLNKTIDTLRNDTSLVISQSSDARVGAVFADIMSKSSQGIIIKSFLYKKQGKEVLKVTVVGVAKTRDDLLSFTKELENLTMFDHVNVPVSNFAKEKNIEFSLDLVEAPKS